MRSASGHVLAHISLSNISRRYRYRTDVGSNRYENVPCLDTRSELLRGFWQAQPYDVIKPQLQRAAPEVCDTNEQGSNFRSK